MEQRDDGADKTGAPACFHESYSKYDAYSTWACEGRHLRRRGSRSKKSNESPPLSVLSTIAGRRCISPLALRESALPCREIRSFPATQPSTRQATAKPQNRVMGNDSDTNRTIIARFYGPHSCDGSEAKLSSPPAARRTEARRPNKNHKKNIIITIERRPNKRPRLTCLTSERSSDCVMSCGASFTVMTAT